MLFEDTYHLLPFCKKSLPLSRQKVHFEVQNFRRKKHFGQLTYASGSHITVIEIQVKVHLH